MRILLFFGVFCFFHTHAQIRYYGTQEYAEFLKSSGKLTLADQDLIVYREIQKPVILSLTFILRSKEVTEAQLSHQIAVLNEDFGNITFERSDNKSEIYHSYAVDTDIRFCTSFEKFEDYTSDTMHFEQAEEYVRTFKLGRRESIPVVICELEKVAGFVHPPGYVVENDVIFLDKDFIAGASTEGFGLGKTLTHLLGTYLGLGEMWDCKDDGIPDTPLMSAQHFEQTGGWSSCYSYVMNTMPQNFMYNTEDIYMNMFTPGQKIFMLHALSFRRNHLVRPNYCQTINP